MAKIEITYDFVKISENNTVFYQDNLDNFKEDCVALSIKIPFLPDTVVFTDEAELPFVNKYIVDKGNQSGLSLELDDFCKLCFLKKDNFAKSKTERDKPKKLTLEEKKQAARQTIKLACFNARLKISGTTDTNKTASWSVYKDIALRYKSNQITAVEKSCFEQEISLRKISGETFNSFVDKIIQNSELFLKATTLIMGAEKRALLDVDLCLTDQDIDAAILKLTNVLGKI
jgi:hypothetical protein